MNTLMRWLRSLPFRKSARRSPEREVVLGSPAQDDPLGETFRTMRDKMMRPHRDYVSPEPDYDDKGACP
jgi:hypothetical protein